MNHRSPLQTVLRNLGIAFLGAGTGLTILNGQMMVVGLLVISGLLVIYAG